jgi:hypothetical protein
MIPVGTSVLAGFCDELDEEAPATASVLVDFLKVVIAVPGIESLVPVGCNVKLPGAGAPVGVAPEMASYTAVTFTSNHGARMA